MAIFIFQIISINLPMKPDIFILGIIPENIVHHGSTRKLVDTRILQSKASDSSILEESGKAIYFGNNMSFCLAKEKHFF